MKGNPAENMPIEISNSGANATPPRTSRAATSSENGIESQSEPTAEDATVVKDGEPNRTSGAESAKAQLSPTQIGVIHLVDYVNRLVELADKPVWSLASYGNLVLHEQELRDRIGIHHDLIDADGPVYLKIDRLRQTDPPEPTPAAKDWVTIGRDPFKEPVVHSLRTVAMTAEEAARLLALGIVDTADIAPTLKPQSVQDMRDVVLVSTDSQLLTRVRRLEGRRPRLTLTSGKRGANGLRQNGRDAIQSMSTTAFSVYNKP